MAYSNDLRVSAVSYFLNHNLQYRDVAAIFGVGVATMHRWVSAYSDHGVVDYRTSTGRPRILSRENDSAFQEMVLKNADSTLEKLSEIWETQQGQKLTIFCVSRAIRRLGLTRKKRLFVQRKERAKITSKS